MRRPTLKKNIKKTNSSIFYLVGTSDIKVNVSLH